MANLLDPNESPLSPDVTADAWGLNRLIGRQALERLAADARRPVDWGQVGNLGMGIGTGALGMARFIPHQQAEMAARAMAKMGLVPEYSASTLSSSRYLNVNKPGSDLDALKIRFADHDLPSRYGSGEYGVGPYAEAHGNTWADAVAKAARYFGVDAPKYVTNRLSQAPASAAPVPVFSEIAKKQYDMLASAFPEAKLTQGAPNSALLARQLAAQFEAMNPGQVTWIRSLDPNFKPSP